MEIKDSKGNVIAKITSARPAQEQCQEGVWLEMQCTNGTRPTICLIAQQNGNFYVGAYKNIANSPKACDFAVTLTANGPELQILKGDKTKIINLYDFIDKIEKELI